MDGGGRLQAPQVLALRQSAAPPSGTDGSWGPSIRHTEVQKALELPSSNLLPFLYRRRNQGTETVTCCISHQRLVGGRQPGSAHSCRALSP